jgi:tetratricopeptide (TPR) repeat protein
VLVGASGLAQASPRQELQDARATFLKGDYEKAIAIFSSLLYPTSRLAKTSEIAEAHLLLGVCFVETGKRDSAIREFEEALFLDDGLTLDESLFSKNAINVFNRSRKEILAKAKEAKEREALSKALENLVVYEKHQYWVNFVPFGAGQFQNGQRSKGVAFFIGQAVSGGASLGLWSYQVFKYGFRGQVPRDEVDTVNTLQIFQVGSSVVFYSLMAWGIVDSLYNYQHEVKRKADPALLKDYGNLLESGETSSLMIVPNASPDSAGLSVMWEF